jgi:hypothetical protein
MQADITIILSFLTKEFDRGLKHSSICGVITAIAKVTNIDSNILLSMFKKGAYNLRPPTPKYHCIWDSDKLLAYLEHMDMDHQCTLV